MQDGAVRAHLWIEGKVQGVWFRESVRQEAESIGGLQGFVRNLPDGRVEAVVQGPRDKVEALVVYCRRGPERARVDAVEVREETPVDGEGPFRVER